MISFGRYAYLAGAMALLGRDLVEPRSGAKRREARKSDGGPTSKRAKVKAARSQRRGQRRAKK